MIRPIPNLFRSRTTRYSLCASLIIAVFCFTCLIKYVIVGNSTVKAGAAVQQAKNPHVLAAAYYTRNDDLIPTLILSNQGPHPMEIKPTLFDLKGNRFDVPPVSINSLTGQGFDLREWIASAGDSFKEGSVQVLYRGDSLELGGVVTLVDAGRSLMFDQELAEPKKVFRSSQLEGVWWMPSNKSEARLAVSNTTDGQVSATVSVKRKSAKTESTTLLLNPHETRVIALEDIEGNRDDKWPKPGEISVGDPDDQDVETRTAAGQNREGARSRKSWKEGGVSIKHSGDPGAIIACGFVRDAEAGYSSIIEFSDPKTAKTSKLDGAGLRIGNIDGERLGQVVVVRNIDRTPNTVRGRIPYTLSNGRKGEVQLPRTELGPGETKSIYLDPFIERDIHRRRVAAAGLELEYTGEPGSLVAMARSYTPSDNHVFRLTMVDAEARPSGTGRYPWTLDDGASAVVYIKNVTNERQPFTVEINFEGGAYTLGLQSIEAGETRVFDIRELCERQAPDDNKTKLPPDLSRGQFHWSVQGKNPRALIGRLEQTDTTGGMSMTAACDLCCGDSWSTGFFVGPQSGYVGDTPVFVYYQVNMDCFGLNLTPFINTQDGWYSENPGIIGINQASGAATVLNSGSTRIDFNYYAARYFIEGTEPQYCNSEFLNIYDFYNYQANPIEVTFQKSDGSSLPSPLRVGVSSSAANRTQNLRVLVSPSERAGDFSIAVSDKLNLSNVSRSGGTITFSIVGKDNMKSDSRGDQYIRARYNPFGINYDRSASVVVPWQIGTPHDTTGGGVVIQNMALNVGTSPPIVNIPIEQYVLLTGYFRNLTITVKDQFNDSVGEAELYRGSAIYEYDTTAGKYQAINQNLTASSTYTDPVGGTLTKQTLPYIVSKDDTTTINSWLNSSPPTMPAGTGTQNYLVRVDSFVLNVGIVNRVWTTMPPNGLTITWP